MSARRKLNIAYLNGSLILASLSGWFLESWTLFGVLLLILVASQLYSGEIRPPRRNRKK